MKARVTFALLVAFALWPLVHHGLVRTVRIDPWKFAGWSMYIVPQRPPLIEIALQTREGWQDLTVEDLSDRDIARARAYSGFRRIRRDELPPDDLAWPLLQRRGDATAVRIRISDFSLDVDSARVQLTAHEYVYPPSG